MDACAEAYLLTGDERYGQQARRLIYVSGWDPNGSTSLPHYDDPGSEVVQLCPRVYDYIYPLLSEAGRRKAREVLAIRTPQLYAAVRARPFERNPFGSHATDYYISDLTEACRLKPARTAAGFGVAARRLWRLPATSQRYRQSGTGTPARDGARGKRLCKAEPY